VVWNGPMGVFEKPAFAEGTLGVARAVTDGTAFSVIGGGDTISAVRRAGVVERIGYVSTAGGAFLEFLEGRALPGVDALTDA
jgi:phosphoglycerate kinase